jgi:hypothetical protein
MTRLYKSSGSSWEYSGILGAAVIVADQNKRTYYIRIVNLESRQISWEQEFYENFNYTTPTAWLHTLETDSGIVALSFADEIEAKEFLASVLYCKNTPVKTDEERQHDKASKKEAKKKERRRRRKKKI